MKLELGTNTNFEIRKEKITGAINSSILFLSDLHFKSSSAEMAAKLLRTVTDLDPEIVLLGGDYADSNKGQQILEQFIGTLGKRKNVIAIAGNHDHYTGIETIRTIMVNSNVSWLEPANSSCKIADNDIRIDARPTVGNKSALSILCLHEPGNIKTLDEYDLVFAGHLHGSQVVLWKAGDNLYPGRLFYRWNRLKYISGRCHYFISKGLGDTLPIRYNCKKDLIFVEIHALKPST